MRPWHYHPAGDLGQAPMDRLTRFPREPDMLAYGLRSISAVLIRLWLRTYHRLTIEGLEHLPRGGSFVMVANHTSHLDALCLLAALPLRKLHRAFPAAAADYFFVSLPRVALAVFVVNALPFGRRSHVRRSLALCRDLLAHEGAEGNVLIVFPEGTRSAGGPVGPFKPGVGSLVAGTGVPVVPCHLAGAGEALPKGSWLPRPKRITLTIGPARTYPDAETGRGGAHDVCDDLRRAVGALSGATGA